MSKAMYYAKSDVARKYDIVSQLHYPCYPLGNQVQKTSSRIPLSNAEGATLKVSC
jgi:hypothetical protein